MKTLKCKVIRSARKTISVEVISADEILVRAPYFTRSDVIRRFVEEKSDWIARTAAKIEKRNAQYASAEPLGEEELKILRERAREYITARVVHYAGLMGVNYGRITIRTQKTRWGSCSADGNLNFNALLMLAPAEVIDSVVVHELCHLIELNHSRRFYEYVYKYCPDYGRHHGWLKEHGPEIMGRIINKNA
ncbi:MAG: M48 family metallopeptidase [Oscillospiraceae bacterium]|nr:M48 family metallopeptidase [Oscillospiraceae bacterium]